MVSLPASDSRSASIATARSADLLLELPTEVITAIAEVLISEDLGKSNAVRDKGKKAFRSWHYNTYAQPDETTSCSLNSFRMTCRAIEAKAFDIWSKELIWLDLNTQHKIDRTLKLHSDRALKQIKDVRIGRPFDGICGLLQALPKLRSLHLFTDMVDPDNDSRMSRGEKITPAFLASMRKLLAALPETEALDVLWFSRHMSVEDFRQLLERTKCCDLRLFGPEITEEVRKILGEAHLHRLELNMRPNLLQDIRCAGRAREQRSWKAEDRGKTRLQHYMITGYQLHAIGQKAVKYGLQRLVESPKVPFEPE